MCASKSRVQARSPRWVVLAQWKARPRREWLPPQVMFLIHEHHRISFSRVSLSNAYACQKASELFVFDSAVFCSFRHRVQLGAAIPSRRQLNLPVPCRRTSYCAKFKHVPLQPLVPPLDGITQSSRIPRVGSWHAPMCPTRVVWEQFYSAVCFA